VTSDPDLNGLCLYDILIHVLFQGYQDHQSLLKGKR